MTAQPSDNVRPIRPLTKAQEALSEALNRPEKGQLDVLLKMEAAKHPDPQAAAIAELAAKGDAIGLVDAAFPGGVVIGLLDTIRARVAERDQARRVTVAQEQQLAEIERLAHQWAEMKSGAIAGIGGVLLDIVNGNRGDHDTPAA